MSASRFWLPRLLIPLALLLFGFAGLSVASSVFTGFPFSEENWLRAEIFNRENSKIWAELGDYARAVQFEPMSLKYSLQLSQEYSQEENFKASLGELLRIARWRHRETINKNLKVVLPNELIAETTRPYLVTEVADERVFFSSLLYDVGLGLIKSGQVDSAIEFWQFAAKLSPNWSAFQLELASLLFFLGDRAQGLSIINNCLTRRVSRDHCEAFAERFVMGHDVPKPGDFIADVRGYKF